MSSWYAAQWSAVMPSTWAAVASAWSFRSTRTRDQSAFSAVSATGASAATAGDPKMHRPSRTADALPPRIITEPRRSNPQRLEQSVQFAVAVAELVEADAD